MKFLYYRYLVVKSKQLSLIAVEVNKTELLQTIFSRELTFTHYNSSLGYVPIKTEGNYIHAQIGKKSSIKRTKPPEEGFTRESLENWETCNVLINLDTNPISGQTIAFEKKGSVFNDPFIKLDAFVEIINNELRANGYEMEINALTADTDFWQVVNEYTGGIEELNLHFSAPNLFGVNNSLDEELKNATDLFGITSTDISLQNSEGNLKLPPDNKFLKEGVALIAKGGGKYKIKLKHNKEIISGEAVKSKDFDIKEIDLQVSDPEIFKGLVKQVFEWLE